MTFIHEQPVYAQLLKGHDIVLALLVIQLCETYFQCPAGLLHLFDGVVFSTIVFQLGDGILDIVDLALDGRDLTLP